MYYRLAMHENSNIKKEKKNTWLVLILNFVITLPSFVQVVEKM